MPSRHHHRRHHLFAMLTTALMLGCQQWSGPLEPIPMGNSYPITQEMSPMQQATIIQPNNAQPPGTLMANPLFVPVTNPDLAWEHMIDVVDDYFRVQKENRVQAVGNVISEGRVDTFPQVGATWLEPHRPDSVGWDNRWESTFQTIRRQAVLRVVPQQGGFLIDVVVNKELEDLPRPENSTAGAATFRHDNSLPSRLGETVNRTRFSKNWIPLGRDCMVEQQMLAEIQARISGAR